MFHCIQSGIILVHMGIDRDEVSSLIKSTHEKLQSSCTAIAETLDIVAKTTERVRATQRRLEEVDWGIERLRLFYPMVTANRDAPK